MREDTSIENLSFIVEAVNSHAQLKERVGELEQHLKSVCDDFVGHDWVKSYNLPSSVPEARAALSKQEGE